ncbi:MAG TPA: biopolymer transporter ExbD [Phycisphaerales bacterium]|nr:biopolymer transporter ExbD [Phycisphaerales bacterium]
MTRRAAHSGGFTRRDALHTHSLHFGPNMTPMVDVVMVILVFFMASAAFIGSDWYLRAALVPDAQKRAATTTTTPAPDPLAQRIEILLDVNEAGDTVVTGMDFQRAPLVDFLERMRNLPKGDATSKLQVVIRPAFAVPYEDAVKAHEACRSGGIWKVGLGTRDEVK